MKKNVFLTWEDIFSRIEYIKKKYKIDKKDINHGTNSCLCTISPEDETIIRLKESSSKLKKVLSSL